jgi:hypothetical protein
MAPARQTVLMKAVSKKPRQALAGAENAHRRPRRKEELPKPCQRPPGERSGFKLRKSVRCLLLTVPFVLSLKNRLVTCMATQPNEETEIRALIDDLTKGIRAKDVNGVMSLYAEEKVQFLLAPPLKYSGANAIKAEDLQDWFSSFQGPIGYEIRDLEVATGKQIAFCTP